MSVCIFPYVPSPMFLHAKVAMVYTMKAGTCIFFFFFFFFLLHVQSTLVILKSKGLYEILGDIRTSTYQICGTEENS